MTAFAYATTEPRKTSLAPGTAVRRAATMPPVQDSAVASVSPRSRQRPRTISAIERSSSPKRYRPSVARSESATRAPSLLRAGIDEQVDVDLELAGADRHLDAVALPARRRERLGDGRLGRPEEAEHPVLARRQLCASTRRTASVSSALGQSRWSSRGGPGRTTTTTAAEIEHEARCRSGEPERQRALRPRRLLAHAGREVHVRPAEPVRDRSRDRADLLLELARREPAPSRRRARRARPSGRRASGRGRPRRGRDPRRIPPGTRARGPRRDLRRSRSTPARAPGAPPRRRETVHCGPPARP